MLTSLSYLAAMDKIKNNISTMLRPLGLINTSTKKIANTPPFMKVVYGHQLLTLTMYGLMLWTCCIFFTFAPLCSPDSKR